MWYPIYMIPLALWKKGLDNMIKVDNPFSTKESRKAWKETCNRIMGPVEEIPGYKEFMNGDDMTRSVDLSPANNYANTSGYLNGLKQAMEEREKECLNKLDIDSQNPIPIPYCAETKQYYVNQEYCTDKECEGCIADFRQDASNYIYSDREKGWVIEEHTTGAQKEISGKLRMDLIPPEALDAMAEVLTFGAKKYSDRNWEKGLQYEKHHLSAMYRHVNKWRKGIDNDEESGYNHMKHALWHIMAIITQIERGRTDLDDRVLTK